MSTSPLKVSEPLPLTDNSPPDSIVKSTPETDVEITGFTDVLGIRTSSLLVGTEPELQLPVLAQSVLLLPVHVLGPMVSTNDISSIQK